MRSKLLVIFLGLALAAHAQVDVGRFQNIVQSVSSGSAAYGSGFKGSYNARGIVKGDPYLDSSFLQTNFRFHKTNSQIKTPSRYDIFNNEFEIQTTGGVRILKSDLVSAFATQRGQDSLYYVNAGSYWFEGTRLVGFLNVLSEGKIPLLKLIRLEIVKPSYNASLEVGDRNAHIIKKDAFFCAIGNDLHKVKGKKKDILKLFEFDQEKVTSFAETNKLDFKKEADLKLIFDFYNQLSK